MHYQNPTTNISNLASRTDARQLDFSGSWDIDSLKQIILEEGVRSSIQRGKFVFRQGEVVDKIYLIQTGCVAFTRHCAEGHRQVLDFFYRESVFSDLPENSQPTTFSAQCLLDTQAYALSKASLRRIATITPEIFRTVNSLMLRLLCQAYDSLYNIGCRHGVERVAFTLCKIFDGFNAGIDVDSARFDCNIPIRQIDIADAIGVTPVYLNQILKSLKEDGVIDINKGTINITNIKILKDICNYEEFSSIKRFI
jgi:CRP-like cAMP-binding protein